MAYYAQIEGMDENEYRQFRRELVAEPGQKVSRGTSDLMRLMAMQGAPRSRG